MDEDPEDSQRHYGDDLRDFIDTSGHWLDYQIEREFTSAAPPQRLMRFMPLEQYLSILTTKSLYIPRATEYDDPYDCVFPGSLADDIRQKLVDSCDEPEFSLPSDADHSKFVQDAEDLLSTQLAEEFASEVPGRWFVSCWHAGEALTDLMWRSYGGHKGVCVTCDGPALLTQLRNSVGVKRFRFDKERNLDKFEFLHAFCNYEDPVYEIESRMDEGPLVTVRHPAFHKHHFFRLDQEFRFAVRVTDENFSAYAAGASLDLTACNASISTSPLCPPWIAAAIESVTRQFYPNIAVERLDLGLE